MKGPYCRKDKWTTIPPQHTFTSDTLTRCAGMRYSYWPCRGLFIHFYIFCLLLKFYLYFSHSRKGLYLFDKTGINTIKKNNSG